MTKTQLRKRWSDPEFLDALKIPRDRIPSSSELSGLDLRGVPKLGNADPLWHFVIHQAAVEEIDFSFGDGCLVATSSTLKDLRFEEFRFDRATRFSRSSFRQCDFQRSRLRLCATDCEFEDCDFDLSTFAGGHSEYGFTRCIFIRCTFRSARWKGTYFKACTFDASDLTRFQVIDSLVTSIKHRDCMGYSPDIFTGGEVRSIQQFA